MRALKFRAWSKTDKVMIYDLNSPRLVHGELREESDDYIFMQYTGLKDKNGKEIYEGDISKIKVWCGSLYTICNLPIIFKDQRFGYELYCGSGDYEVMNMDFSDEFEVIGNIHENHELLENK